MNLKDKIIAELQKYPESAAISGSQLAQQLSCSYGEVLSAARELEAASRERGSEYIVITTNQRDDRSIEPPDEIYLHLSPSG
ncbi:hypothetical protein [Mycobacterium colombiense]|uniref:hypothetical protein n=1 Tax=Mycobacterium colombiense TaxID=339268 RepID=UPI0012DB5867|nr:hypothetical protein [Mycobacterium colombiense]